MARFRLGINYWPAAAGMRWWQRFEPEIVAADFGRIRQGGFDSVRLFLRWEDFQPVASEVDTQMLARLRVVADLAEQAGLSLMPTLFTGHMSGVNWIPPWALGGNDGDLRFRVLAQDRASDLRIRNWYTDAAVLASQELLASEAASCLSGHAALWAWDLGNENSNCVIPPSQEAGSEWLGRMCSAIRKADPGRPITVGLHMEDLEEDRRIGPQTAAQHCDFLCMHGYPMYCSWAGGDTDAMLLPFLAAITSWLGGGADLLFAEFGAPTYRHSDPQAEGFLSTSTCTLLEEEEAANYTERALDALQQSGGMGAMLWCYADYDPQIWHEEPFDVAVHERFFGLWRPDGSPKPAVAKVRAFQDQNRRMPTDPGWIDIAPDAFYQQPRLELARLYAKFCTCHRKAGGA